MFQCPGKALENQLSQHQTEGLGYGPQGNDISRSGRAQWLGDRMALGMCAWSVLCHCLMFSQETLISFTPSSSSLSLRQPVIHQQGPTPGVQTLP